MKIEYKDTSKLNQTEIETLHRITEEYSEKLSNTADIKEIVIDVKTHEKGGKRKRYDIGLHVSDDKKFNTRVEDWDLEKVMHEAFKKILQEIEHKDRTEGKPSRNILKTGILKKIGIFRK